MNAVFGMGPLSWGVGFVYIGYDSILLIFVAYQMLRIIHSEKVNVVAETPTLQPSLAVIVTARNEARVLHDCLNALDEQTDLPDVVFWIDDGSTDQTKVFLKNHEFKRLKNFQMIFKEHSGKARSLNEVWPLVPSEVIVTLDADTILEKDAIEQIRTEFAQNPKLAVTGGLLTPRSIQKPGRLFENFQRFEYIRSFLARRAWMSKNALVLVSGAFAAYRKKALIEVNGYDPRSLVEDYDLTHRIYRYSYDHDLNYEVHVSVRARAYTDVPVTLRQFLRQRQRWFAGFLQTQFRNGDMVGNKKYGTLGRYMLVIKSADTLQPIYGLVTLATLFLFIFGRRIIYPLVWKALLAKIILDLIFHYGSVALYYRWQKRPAQAKVWFLSTVSTFLEPISFQILRHLGALMGWIAFLRGRFDWTPQR